MSPATGLPRGALVQPVTSQKLYGEDLTLGIGEGQVLYRVVPGDSTWRTAYNTQYAGLGRLGREVARRALQLEGFDEDLVPE